METREQVKTMLFVGWNGMILGGLITYDELHDMLLDQVTGSMDMSADELDIDIARLLGWDMENITDEQWEIWRNIVDEAANEFMMK